jgi:hypothetical protein
MSHRRERAIAAAIALLSGLLVLIIAFEVFPYHSSNHDEGVYLQQAELLLSGQFTLSPGEFGSAVRPWFFVDAGDQYYPKYQPLPAGFFAIGMAIFGEPRLILGLVAAGNTALVYVLGSMTFDRRVGLLASALFATAPMTLLTSAVFLAYAPTTLFTLSFAVAYLSSYRSGRIVYASLAGLAIGVAFFMRPFTAVLFATPFVAHALYEVTTVLRTAGLRPVPRTIRRQGTTAVVGIVFVVLTFAYNATVTGDPLLFPYEAFAPEDGPGFGHRQLLDHSIEYTPALALETNAHVLWYLATRWVPAGLLGSGLALTGVLASRRGSIIDADRPARWLLLGLFVTVPAGNILFWGNFNILADMGDPTDGFLGQFGPFYHFDLLAPVAIFAAAGAVALFRSRQRIVGGVDRQTARTVSIALLVGGLLILGGANAALVNDPINRNLEHTETYEDAYAPFENESFDNALVLVPTPYGEWLNHPFQVLRNDGDLDGEVIYAMDRSVAENFDVIDAAPDRQVYRYTYRGEWTADPADRDVTPKIERLDSHTGETLTGTTTVGVPDRVSHARVRIETEGGYAVRTVESPGEEIAVEWQTSAREITLESIDGETIDESAALDDVDEAVLKVRLVQPAGATLTYRQAMPVRQQDGEIELLWPPERTVCPHVDDCGREGTYLAEKPDEHRAGVSFETTIESAD